ncbi:MAG: hypothetical protein LAP85_27655 [Acidobacteriia bacterium]|nr:hypothetical protein [Terriglobia bacterium]
MNQRRRCYDYETLGRLLVKRKRKGMKINAILEVFGHLDECGACREAIYHISREMDSSLFIHFQERS